MTAIAYATDERRRELRAMPYAEYLRSPEWKQVRWFALCRDGGCVICGETRRLECHHRTYVRLGEEAAADVVTLCDICHERHHAATARPDEPDALPGLELLRQLRTL